MKKSISLSLEEDIIECIDKYQKEKNLSSRSAAVERIVLGIDSINIEFILSLMKKALSSEFDIREDPKIKTVKKKKIKKEEEKKEKIKNTKIKNSVEDIFNNMPQD